MNRIVDITIVRPVEEADHPLLPWCRPRRRWRCPCSRWTPAGWRAAARPAAGDDRPPPRAGVRHHREADPGRRLPAVVAAARGRDRPARGDRAGAVRAAVRLDRVPFATAVAGFVQLLRRRPSSLDIPVDGPLPALSTHRAAGAGVQRGSAAHLRRRPGGARVGGGHWPRRALRVLHPQRHPRPGHRGGGEGRLPGPARPARRPDRRVLPAAPGQPRAQGRQHRRLGAPLRRRVRATC